MSPDVEERRALEADVDEGGLHAREHAHDLAEVDVADVAAVRAAIDVELDELPVLHQGDAGFLPVELTRISVDKAVSCDRRGPLQAAAATTYCSDGPRPQARASPRSYATASSAAAASTSPTG